MAMTPVTEEEYQRRKRVVLETLARNPSLPMRHFRVNCGFAGSVERMKAEGVPFGTGYKYGRSYKI